MESSQSERAVRLNPYAVVTVREDGDPMPDLSLRPRVARGRAAARE